MKTVRWKVLFITCIVCFLPVLLGVVLWDRLPDAMAIHFDIYNNADGFASKGFCVFGLPVIMTFLQIFCCVMADFDAKKHGEMKNFQLVTKWIIPMTSVVLQTVIIGIGLGLDLDVRKIAAILVGVVLILTGICLPKLDYVKRYKLEPQKARKINCFMGYLLVIAGVFFIISIFLPPVAMIVCVFLLIFFGITGTIYGIKSGRK